MDDIEITLAFSVFVITLWVIVFIIVVKIASGSI